MSIIATAHASDKDLGDLGLVRKGDIISLRRFCFDKLEEKKQTHNRDEKRELLEKILEQNKVKRKQGASNGLHVKRTKGKTPTACGSKKIQLGWLHFDKKRKQFVAVRQSRGGGTRDIHLALDATVPQIIEIGKDLFFPDKSSLFGNMEMMDFSLANFRQETVVDITVDNKVLPFTLERYMHSTKLPKVRLYLASKKKTSNEKEENSYTLQREEDNHLNSCIELPRTQPLVPDIFGNEFDDAIFDQPSFDLHTTRSIIAEQDQAYQESLHADQSKCEEKKQKLLLEMEEAEQQEKLRQSRLLRVPDEPSGGSNAVLIQVRHVHLGIIRRNFQPSDKMLSVYDWVGSRGLLPVHFELSTFEGNVFMPDQSVLDGERSTLNMAPSAATPGLQDDDISFKGLGHAEEDVDDTITEESCPSPDVVEIASLPATQGPKLVKVHRVNIKTDLVNIFSDQKILQKTIEWKVIDDHGKEEEGEGAGVQRDIFSTFWQSIYSSVTLGDLEKVPCIRHDHQKTEWEAIGRVLAYGFKYFGYIPIGLSPVFLASCIHGEDKISDEELLQSFSNYVTSDERDIIKTSLSDDVDCQDEDLLDFLSTYKCFRLPTKDTMRTILLELAHQEIIQRPRYIANCWSTIIGIFKTNISFSSIEKLRELFSGMNPSAKKVIKSLQPTIANESEKQSFDFLKKFIRSLDKSSLKIFLKFITGSDTLVTESIQVSFISVEGMARRPIAHTCGPTLEVPSTYQSYNEMSEEFNNILRAKESWTFNIV
ncbi:hypothetical protein QZH41_014346 [Actinostola sp. cb2023]|nr:hypothetical protein QZH41_014346 [Actinostola sp. cb2023]